MIRVTENCKIEEVKKEPKILPTRPRTLHGRTYKINTPKVGSALYVTVTRLDNKPYELFIYTKDITKTAEFALLGRLISAIFRVVEDPSFVIEELSALYDTSGGYFANGKYMKSLYGEIAEIIKMELETNIEVTDTQEEEPEPIANQESGLKLCPECNELTLKMENGCNTCINPECGYSKCDH